MEREQFPHLDDNQWRALGCVLHILGEEGAASFAAANPAWQVERINQYLLFEGNLVDYARETAPGASPAQASHASGTARPAGTKPLRLKVPVYEGKESTNLLFWFKELEIAMDAALLTDERLKVAFALSNLGGRAKTWVLTRSQDFYEAFPTWGVLRAELQQAFQPPNAAFRTRSKFLACKQGKRELSDYVHELRELAAAMASQPLQEDTMITVFMEGLRVGPPRDQLFRSSPSTFEEAIEIARREDYSLKQARSGTAIPSGMKSSGPSPMDLSAIEQRRSDLLCFQCGKPGHFKRDCPRLASRQQGGSNSKTTFRGASRGRGSSNAPPRGQLNGHSQ